MSLAQAFTYDLHCHSTASDGVLSPAKVVQRAAANGVSVLALTDHDELAGLGGAAEAARTAGIRFVPGVEISITWRELSIHIVGLGVDPENETLATNLDFVRSSRGRRAARIAAELDRLGIEGSLEGAYAHAENPKVIGRTHFARFLVQRGIASDVASVFKRYLARGKPGYVSHQWAELADAVAWIRAGGGRAVVAHPGRYKLPRAELRRFLGEFKAAGGEGIEVVTGSHSPEQYGEFARLAREFEFLASRGSDFHGPEESLADLGRLPPLPADLKPVWHDW
ncbi:MAG TPA: 3',5'-nucleoside bisphosphate phosphatase [Burkholderiales bacterium]|nr:3',5'-nucleoside bisphosphate phosphatase [Burkholderiales bacterium]